MSSDGSVELVFLGQNPVGERVYDWLTSQPGADVRGIITETDQLSLLERLQPELAISAGFRHIVPDTYLDVPERGIVNLHDAYLPYNRGANPNVWPLIDGSPAGVAIHYMNSTVDAGPLISRRRVPTRADDTAASLRRRLEEAQIEQFRDCWPGIRDGSVEPTPQPTGGSFHSRSDFVDLWELDLDAETTVGGLISRLQGLSHPPYNNAYFETDGERYYIDIDITPEADIDDEEISRVADAPVYDE